jgi:hypothetical protein
MWTDFTYIDRIIWRNINGIRSYHNYWSLLWRKGEKNLAFIPLHARATPPLLLLFFPLHTLPALWAYLHLPLVTSLFLPSLCLDEKQSIYGLHPFFSLLLFAWRSYTLPISIPRFNHILLTLLPCSASCLTLKMEYIPLKCYWNTRLTTWHIPENGTVLSRHWENLKFLGTCFKENPPSINIHTPFYFKYRFHVIYLYKKYILSNMTILMLIFCT